MQISKAKSEDASEIVLINDAIQKMHAEHYPEVFKYPVDTVKMEKFFRDRISEKDNFIFIARISGKATGYVWCTIQRKQENVFKYSQERIFIHQIAVEPKYHRQGVGRKLMQAVDHLAKENGINKFALDSWEFNKKAHTFFERLGFSRYNINMWREK